MSKCDLCGKTSDSIPVIRTTTSITVGEDEDKEDYHQILICVSCIIKLYRQHCIAPKNRKLTDKDQPKIS